MSDIFLMPIDREGNPAGRLAHVPTIAEEVLTATAAMYESVGYEEPWIGYLGLLKGTVVGTCGFKSAPRDGRVEIAYFTFVEHEGRGYATAMAAELIAIAEEKDPFLTIAAQTLPEPNASHRILEKLNFQRIGSVEHPEDGTVLEWQRPHYTIEIDGEP